MTRSGPTPLPLHLTLAASACMQKGAAGQAMLQGLYEGIKAYQVHTYERPQKTAPVLWQAGEVRVTGDPGAGILAVPSMINRSDILDIHPGRSFLQECGATLLGWGESLNDPAQGDFDRLIEERLIPALESFSRPVQTIGYCLGGTALIAAAALRPELFRSLVLIAAPWDFHAGNQSMRLLVQSLSPGAFAMMGTQGRLPGLWTQSLFAALDPEKTARKFAAFAGLPPDDPEGQIFVAVEDWLNDPVDLPPQIARACIQDFYFFNQPVEGGWQVGGQAIDPSNITCPVLIVTGARDKLVPHESAQALLAQIPHAAFLHEDFGHIGLLASKAAPQQIWVPVKKWMTSHKSA